MKYLVTLLFVFVFVCTYYVDTTFANLTHIYSTNNWQVFKNREQNYCVDIGNFTKLKVSIFYFADINSSRIIIKTNKYFTNHTRLHLIINNQNFSGIFYKNIAFFSAKQQKNIIKYMLSNPKMLLYLKTPTQSFKANLFLNSFQNSYKAMLYNCNNQNNKVIDIH